LGLATVFLFQVSDKRMRTISIITISIITIFITLIACQSTYADTASASQQIRIIIPKVALIDVDNTTAPLEISFTPMTDAGDNFSKATTVSYYDVSSNIAGLKLYAKINKNLKKKYNLHLKVNESGKKYKNLTKESKKISSQGRQAQVNQELKYKIVPAFANRTIPYGNINVTITYTLVEP